MNPIVGTDREVLLAIFREVTRVINSLTSEDLLRIVSGAARFKLSLDPPRPKENRSKKTPKTIHQVQAIVTSLQSLGDRDKGIELLTKEGLTRKELSDVCRILDIPALKTEKMERLRERIVEATIGFRLRSDAIQGNLPAL